MRWSVLARLAALAALFAPAPSGVHAQSWRDTGFYVARVNPSARAAAIGGAGALSGDDPAGLFYNPAALTPGMDRSVGLGYLNHLSDVRSGTALYVRDLPARGATVAASLRFLSYGTFDRTAEDGTASGTFGAGETALTLTASREVAPRVRAGASVHGLFVSIDDASAQALAADLGATYDVPSQLLTLGASVRSAGRVLSSLGETADRLPLDVRLTATKRLRYLPLTVTVAATDLQHFDGPEVDSSLVRRSLDHLRAGAELQLGRALTVRAGYVPRVAADLRSGRRIELAGVGLGFGIALRRVALDYAYNGWSDFGGLHQFGVRTRL